MPGGPPLGAVSVSRAVSCPAGTTASLAANPGGKSRTATRISPAKPSLRMAFTVRSTVSPLPSRGLSGLTSKAKSGRGGATVRR